MFQLRSVLVLSDAAVIFFSSIILLTQTEIFGLCHCCIQWAHILYRITRSGWSWRITLSRRQYIAAIAREIGYSCINSEYNMDHTVCLPHVFHHWTDLQFYVSILWISAGTYSVIATRVCILVSGPLFYIWVFPKYKNLNKKFWELGWGGWGSYNCRFKGLVALRYQPYVTII
jgi:hypothetical protein